MQCEQCKEVMTRFEPRHKSLSGLVLCEKCFNLIEIVAKKRLAGEDRRIIDEYIGNKFIGKGIVTNNEYNKHIMRIPCPSCGKEIEETIDLNASVNEKMSIDCNACNGTLEFQISDIVAFEYGWPCSYCGQSFDSQQNADVHEADCEFKKYIPK